MACITKKGAIKTADVAIVVEGYMDDCNASTWL